MKLSGFSSPKNQLRPEPGRTRDSDALRSWTVLLLSCAAAPDANRRQKKAIFRVFIWQRIR